MVWTAERGVEHQDAEEGDQARGGLYTLAAKDGPSGVERASAWRETEAVMTNRNILKQVEIESFGSMCNAGMLVWS